MQRNLQWNIVSVQFSDIETDEELVSETRLFEMDYVHFQDANLLLEDIEVGMPLLS